MSRLVGLLLLAGCAANPPAVAPQILSFNYRVLGPYASAALTDAVIGAVASGSRSFQSLLTSDGRDTPCNFTASFATTGSTPNFSTSGNPADRTLVLEITASRPIAIAAMNPPGCLAPQDIAISIGGPSRPLAIGAQTALTQGSLTLAGNGTAGVGSYPFSEVFQATVRSFDMSSRRATGEFRFLNRLSTDRHQLLVVEGSFALSP
ncbi:MAG: hypothetical protein M3Z16_02320 [Pseudomonadota bacterium]|nr:hypothetical protein [Pseudomonadota bacterium]